MKSKHCLIADDSKSARFTLKKLLEKLGHTVDLVESGDAALKFLEATHPEIIFMDHLMPGMDGFETTREIQKGLQLKHIPIIMCTSKEGESYEREAKQAGATSTLPKPASLQQLEALFQQLEPDISQSREAAQADSTKTLFATPDQGTAKSTNPTKDNIERVTHQISTGVAREVARQVVQEKWVEFRPLLHQDALELSQRMLSDQIEGFKEKLARNVIKECQDIISQQNKKNIQQIVDQRLAEEFIKLEKKVTKELNDFAREMQHRIPDTDSLHEALIEEAKSAAEFTAAHKSVDAAQQVAKEITRKEIATLMQKSYLPQIESHLHGQFESFEMRLKQLKIIASSAVAVASLGFILAIIL